MRRCEETQLPVVLSLHSCTPFLPAPHWPDAELHSRAEPARICQNTVGIVNRSIDHADLPHRIRYVKTDLTGANAIEAWAGCRVAKEAERRVRDIAKTHQKIRHL